MTGLHNYSFVINEAHRYVCNHNQRNKKQEKQTRRKMKRRERKLSPNQFFQM